MGKGATPSKRNTSISRYGPMKSKLDAVNALVARLGYDEKRLFVEFMNSRRLTPKAALSLLRTVMSIYHQEGTLTVPTGNSS